MRKLFALTVLLAAFATTSPAQTHNVTKFLGIPVDGTKEAMIQKLKLKGFAYDSNNDALTGEFNGRDVQVYVMTNNKKVWRIAVADAVPSSNSAKIKTRFNILCSQFEKNKKYVGLDDYRIPEDEDITYNMIVKDKEYQAAYFQYNQNDSTDAGDKDALFKRIVWFTIIKGVVPDTFSIMMYYDNEYNHADGEDL